MNCKRRLKPSQLNLGLKFIAFLAGLLLVNWLYRSVSLSRWRGGQDFSWIIQQQENLSVYSFIPEYRKLVIWKIPGNTLVEAAGGYGRYQWKNLFSLGEIDGRGGQILSQTSQAVLGLPVQGWQVGRDSNLTWIDRCLWQYWTGFKVKQRLEIDLDQEGVLEEIVQPDGSRLLTVVYHRLDQLVNRETFSQVIADEKITLALINGSRLARVISNHGIDLANVSADSELPDRSIIWLKEPELEKTRTVVWLKQLLPQAELVNSGRENQWTGVVLEIGKDYN